MRFDTAGPRTWLLAGTAVWALLALLLALLGMGRQVEPLAEDPSLVRALPALPKPAPERLGPLTQYSETANRPLFADDRRPKPFSLQPENAEEAQAKAFDYKLTSVLITPTFKMAILTAPDGSTAPLRVKLGEPHEQIPGWTLQTLNPRSATFVGPEGERTLELGVFDGVGGEAPTMAVAPPAPTTPGSDLPVEPPPVPPVADAAAPAAPQPDPNASRPQPQQQQTEQAQMDAIRKRIEARRAQLRQEALQEQQQLRRQNQKPPVK